MIIQGSNSPLVIEFDQDVSGCAQLVVTMWGSSAEEPVKRWNKADMQVDGATVSCPLGEEETAALSVDAVAVEAKGLDENGNTLFWDEMRESVKKRRDRVISMTGA